LFKHPDGLLHRHIPGGTGYEPQQARAMFLRSSSRSENRSQRNLEARLPTFPLHHVNETSYGLRPNPRDLYCSREELLQVLRCQARIATRKVYQVMRGELINVSNASADN